MADTPPLDLSKLSLREAREHIGELVEMSLKKSRIAILVMRTDDILTILDSHLLTELEPETLIHVLLSSWDEDQIAEFLQHLDHLRERAL